VDAARFRLSRPGPIHPCGHASRGCQGARSPPVGRLRIGRLPRRLGRFLFAFRGLPRRRIYARWRYNGRVRPEKGAGNVPGPVVVWACLDQNCVPHVGSPYRWTYFENMNAALTNPETVDVRVVVRDRGRVVFDQATRLDQFDEWQPNGPGCEPTFARPVSRQRPNAT
jgi:hypothetical protein